MKTYTPSELRSHRLALIAALRSGHYTQTRGWLRITSHVNQSEYEHQEHFAPIGYCCLGVACELVDPLRWIVEPFNHYASFGLYSSDNKHDDTDEVSSFMPPDIMAYYGFRNEAGEYWLDGKPCTLSQDNDNGATFRTIADTIERAMDNPHMNLFAENVNDIADLTGPQSDPVSVANLT